MLNLAWLNIQNALLNCASNHIIQFQGFSLAQ